MCTHFFSLPFSRLDHSQLLTSSVHILNKAGVHMLHKHIVVGEVGVNFLTSLPILFLQNSCNCSKSGKQFNCRFTLLQNFNCKLESSDILALSERKRALTLPMVTTNHDFRTNFNADLHIFNFIVIKTQGSHQKNRIAHLEVCN